MMRKLLHSAAIMLIVIAFAACGGKKKTVAKTSFDLTPIQTEVKGYLSGAFEVVSGTYTFDYSQSEAVMQVKLRSFGVGDSDDYSLGDGNHGPLYVAICDSFDRPITGYEEIYSDFACDALLKGMIRKVNEENCITFKMFVTGKNRLPDNTAKFYVYSKEARESGSSSTYSSTSGSKEWDKLLNDYEAYVDKYIAVVKKAASGNESALDDAIDLEDKAEQLEKSLNAALDKNDLSLEQANRLAKIIAKFGKAMNDLDKAEDADWGDDDGDDW